MLDQQIVEPNHQVASVRPATPAAQKVTAQRLASVDTFRGVVLFLLIAEMFLQLYEVGKALPESRFWNFLGDQQSHVVWVGVSLHDLIHPSFTFLVGVALPFSLASRLARGESSRSLIAHAAWRSLLLIVLGIFLRSTGLPKTNFVFTDTLTQIGLGYFPLFLIGMAVYHPAMARGQRRAFRAAVPWVALIVLLIAHWAAYALYPLPGPDFDYQTVGVAADWTHHFTGFAAHWNKGSNVGAAFDRWFLNLFPQYDGRPFVLHPGGYNTLNFIPHLGTMLLGLIAGGWLKSLVSHLPDRSDRAYRAQSGNKKAWEIGVRTRLDQLAPHTSGEVLLRLVLAGIGCLVLGLVLHAAGICPMVKRLWTPSWVFVSGGWCFLALAAFYYVVDVRGYKAWAFPFAVLGMNSIAVYCLADMGTNFFLGTVQTHLGLALGVFGEAYVPLLRGLFALAIFWLIFYWMYRRGIYVKL